MPSFSVLHPFPLLYVPSLSLSALFLFLSLRLTLLSSSPHHLPLCLPPRRLPLLPPLLSNAPVPLPPPTVPLSPTSQSDQRKLSRPVAVVGVRGLKVCECVCASLLCTLLETWCWFSLTNISHCVGGVNVCYVFLQIYRAELLTYILLKDT